MSDADLRELERRFRATGTVEDEAEWLRARVLAGALDARDVDLAAHLGNVAALSARGRTWTTPKRLQPWAREVGQWGQEACVRVALAGARAGVAIWERKRRWKFARTVASWSSVDPRDALAQLERQLIRGETPRLAYGTLSGDAPPFLRPLDLVEWVYTSHASSREARLTLPCSRSLAEAKRLAAELSARGLQTHAVSQPDGEARLSVLRDYDPRLSPGKAFAEVLGYEPARAKLASCNLQGFNDYDAYTEKVFRKLEEAKGKPTQIVEVVGQDVVPWALGYGDPVRDRVEARQRAEAAGE